ncbi:MAG: sigma factor-like helix-turn-helix DNA-binding protein [Oscillospiraceae bacterium]
MSKFDRDIMQGFFHPIREESDSEKEHRLKLMSTLMDMNLTKTQKKYIMLYYMKNMNLAQIATQEGVVPSTVARTLNRGRKRIYRSIVGCELNTLYSQK